MAGTSEMRRCGKVEGNESTRRMADGGRPVTGGAAPQMVTSGSGRRLLIAAIAVIIAVALVIVVVLVLLGGNGRSPEGAFENFVDGVNEEDGGKMVNNTILRFSPDYDMLLQQILNDPDMEDVDITINLLVTLDDEDLTEEQKDNAEELVGLVEEEFDIDIQDYCYVRYNITETFPTDDGDRLEYESDDMLCFKVESKWYIVLEYYFEEY